MLARAVLLRCEQQGITVRVIANLTALDCAWTAVDSLAGHPVITVSTGPRDAAQLAVKRAVDLIGALIGIAVLSPVFLLVALAIKLDSRGPVIFAQERVGLNRRRFRALKFRTMVDGADRMQQDLEHRNEADGPVFKIENDPRVTRVGRILRKLSLDELPQLVNVLRGEMSLVGPRPLPVRDVNRFDANWHKRRFSVKPGITCTWQATRREPTFDEWVRSDHPADLSIDGTNQGAVTVSNLGSASIAGDLDLWSFKKSGGDAARSTVHVGDRIPMDADTDYMVLDPQLAWADGLRENNRYPRRNDQIHVTASARGALAVTYGAAYPWARASVVTVDANGRTQHTWELTRGVLAPPMWSADGSHVIVSYAETPAAPPLIVSLAADGSRRTIGDGTSPAPAADGTV